MKRRRMTRRRYRLLAIAWLIALGGCAKDAPPILPPQEPSLCTFYTPWLMSPEPARLENPDKLRTHAGNNAAHYDKCITNSPKLDPDRKGGPR